MIAMAVSKVNYGSTTLIDLTGDTVTADKLLSGYTAHGADGEAITGTYQDGSGSGIQAQHITAASDTITISGIGAVKVWGYAVSKSTYMTTIYAFVGDGYYRGMSYGTPSKTSATFSISNGTLSGLPSGLTAVDLLVTIGI